MRLAGWLLVVLAVSVGPAVVTSIGCGVDSPQYAGLPNQVPNILGSGVPVVVGAGGTSVATTTTAGAGGASGVGGGTGGSTTVPAQSVCDIAAALTATGNAPCATCEQTQGCLTQYTMCGTTCSGASSCVFGCSGNGTCISLCIEQTPAYESFLNCMLLTCASSCGQPTPIACAVGADAGDGG